jgi:hypothetical protein
MNEIWERVLANSFSGIHKSKIICSVGHRNSHIFILDELMAQQFSPHASLEDIEFSDHTVNGH